MITRNLMKPVSRVISDYGKMAFISGPRQVGKTTLAKQYQKEFAESCYFNWDIITDQKKLINDPYFFGKENRDPKKPTLVIFDEIHKYSRWKNYLKGVYDKFSDEFRFVVTGSGRLDLFKKGGDSLLGRYIGLQLFPLTVGELAGKMSGLNDFKKSIEDPPYSDSKTDESYKTLFDFSGFPEPLIRAKADFYNIWFQEKKALLIREDIRNAYAIRDLSLMEVLSNIIPERIGSPLSINSLREDVGAAFETIRDWLLILEQFYYLFKVRPYTKSVARSIKKEPKLYLYDWVEIKDEGSRFENMIALHLYKAVNIWRSIGEGDIKLFFLRDREKREVDFVIAESNKPICLIECKSSDASISPSLVYFQNKLGVNHAVQLVNKTGVCKKMRLNGKNQWIISAGRWLNLLP